MHDQATGNPKLGLYRLLFERATDPTLILDSAGDVVLANEAARERSADLVAQFSDQTGPNAAELARFRAELETQGRAHGELTVGGRVVAVDGRTHGAQYIVYLRDVTERRRLEHELRTVTARNAIRRLV